MKRKITYIADRHHKIFHKDNNRVHSRLTREDEKVVLVEFTSIFSAIEQGYKPCPSCFREYYDIDTAIKLKDIQDRYK